jgi:hypothetical protein
MKINRSAATKSLTVIASLFLAGSLASCDAAARAGTEVAEALKSAAPSIAAESPAPRSQPGRGSHRAGPAGDHLR